MAKHFTAEFKLEAAKLVVDHGYTYVKAAQAVNVSHSAIMTCSPLINTPRC
ncbi:transposase [Serratia bockelmannii]|uniref:transposase n=1 Tax=Serratia bockelmannii TaxID=2703793 RepID=UPI0038653B56